MQAIRYAIRATTLHYTRAAISLMAVVGASPTVAACYPACEVMLPMPTSTIDLRDRMSGQRIFLTVRAGIVVGAMGCEPARYVGLTLDRARHLARYGGVGGSARQVRMALALEASS